MFDIISWIFGIGAMASLFITYQQNERKNLILYKMCADLCWVFHYLCLGAYGGAIPNFVGIFRELVFVRRGKARWAESVLWPIVFICANFLLGIRTFEAPINLLPICASALVTVSLWLKNPLLTKLLTIPVCTSFLIYDVYAGSWIGVINESFTILSILLSFVKNIKKEKKQ